MHIMTPEDCEYITDGPDPVLKEREYNDCLPWIDRQAGEIKVRLLDDQFYQLRS